MSRILVMGYELPSMAQGAVEARSYRTWQFVEPLLADGHEVCLIASQRNNQLNVPQTLSSSLIYHRLNLMLPNWFKRVDAICDEFKPDAVLGVMLNNGLRATRLSHQLPLWIDLYGDRVTEGQVLSHVRKSHRGMKILSEYLGIILRNADAYSTCSTPQKFALVGQLSMASRLNRHNMGHDLVHTILPGAPSQHADTTNTIKLRGEMVPEDAFVVLWCGGYNVWSDVYTLFKAMNEAMDQDPRIHYVSAGAGVRMPGNDSYERLLEMIAQSPNCERFHMLGWQPSTVVPGLYGQADVGVNLDAFHYETLLGTRTRIVEMMHYGLPVLTTLGCELSYIVQEKGLGLTFKIGDAASFRDQILTLSKDRSLQQQLARQAGQYTREQLSFHKTTEAFLEWAKEPSFAPDHLMEKSKFNTGELANNVRAAFRSLLWRIWALESGE
jgi:glycosyltransferase involved in cell wall biosynthesis